MRCVFVIAFVAIAIMLAATVESRAEDGHVLRVLTCSVLQKRLNLNYQSDSVVEDKPVFTKEESSYPAVDVVSLASDTINDGYLWCDKVTGAAKWISIKFRMADLALPTKSRTAEALVADTICTLTKAAMDDCDAVTKMMASGAMKADVDQDVKTEIAPASWTLTALKDETLLTFDFQAGAGTDLSVPVLRLGNPPPRAN